MFDRLVERYGSEVFKDVDSIELGDDFVEVINQAVGSCDVLLALIGEEWLTIENDAGNRRLDDPDDFVRLEIQAALARQVRVIPILVDGATMPRADQLPSSMSALVRRQALDLSPARFDFDTGRLFEVLDPTIAALRTTVLPARPERGGLGSPGAGEGAAGPPPVSVYGSPAQPAAPRRRKLLVAAAAVVVLAAALLVVTGAFEGDEPGGQAVGASGGYELDSDVKDLDASATRLVYVQEPEDTEGGELGWVDLGDPNAQPRNIEEDAPSGYRGLDLGDQNGKEVLVYSLCTAPDRCDLFRRRFGGTPKRPAEAQRLGASTDTCKDVRPSIADGKVLFVRDECADAGLWIGLGRGRVAQLSRVPAPGVDYDGTVRATLNGRLLTITDMTGTNGGETRIQPVSGRDSFKTPLRLDGSFLYLGYKDSKGYVIARVDIEDEAPQLERHVPAGGRKVAPEALRFGAASGRLFHSGYPRADGTATFDAIARENEPEFRQAAGAVELVP